MYFVYPVFLFLLIHFHVKFGEKNFFILFFYTIDFLIVFEVIK